MEDRDAFEVGVGFADGATWAGWGVGSASDRMLEKDIGSAVLLGFYARVCQQYSVVASQDLLRLVLLKAQSE